MTNVQLYLTIGIPSLLVLLSWLSNNKRFDAIEKRLDGMDARFDRVEARLDLISADLRQFYHLTGTLDGRLQAIEKRQP